MACDDNGCDLRASITRTLEAGFTYFLVVWEAGTQAPVPGKTTIQLRISRPESPAATTLAATDLTSTSAVLHAEVSPTGLETTAWFEWGIGPDYGHTTAPQDLGSGTRTVVMSAELTGLTPGAEYRYRVVAQNAAGVNPGPELTFRWLVTPLRIHPLSRSLQGVSNLRSNGLPNQIYFLEASTNLRTWETLGRLVWQSSGWFEFKHTNDAAASFYRIVSP
ncbi:MAG: fibronectin type III domain-containing protein [Verrucomicrobia bacterium]|nr:fibronectin type III domain-containing protein [Verrucomicrobiota bacterium]